MTHASRLIGRLGAGLALGMLSASLLSGCAHLSQGTALNGRQSQASQGSVPSVDGTSRALEKELAALAAGVNPGEARWVACRACESSQQLARQYGVIRPALFHNFLVNMGLKQRGLCYQWAEDLLAQLQTLALVTLQLHWGIARAGTYREHNCIVVTARGQPFDQGIVLDAWRHSGRVVWAHVSTDHYPWKEGELTLAPAPTRAAHGN